MSNLINNFISNDPHISVSNLLIKLILSGFLPIYGRNVMKKFISNDPHISVSNLLIKLILSGFLPIYGKIL